VELQHVLREDMQVEASLTCIHEALERIDITHKSICKKAIEQDQVAKDLFLMNIMEFDTRQLANMLLMPPIVNSAWSIENLHLVLLPST
jgi:hypothetical protein